MPSGAYATHKIDCFRYNLRIPLINQDYLTCAHAFEEVICNQIKTIMWGSN